MFSVTFSAVYRSAFSWFERDFTFFSTIGADYFVHFSWAIAVTAPVLISQKLLLLFTLFMLIILFIVL